MKIEGIGKDTTVLDEGILIPREALCEISDIIGLPKLDNSGKKRDIQKCNQRIKEFEILKSKIQTAISGIEEEIDECREIQRNLQMKIEAKLEEE